MTPVDQELEELRADLQETRDKLGFGTLNPSSRESLEWKLLALERNIQRIQRNEAT